MPRVATEGVLHLVILNFLIFIAQVSSAGIFGTDLSDTLGLHSVVSDEFRLFQLFTHMFLHGSFAHVALNMFALWMFGVSLEQVWGLRRFVTYFVLCGLGAALLHLGVWSWRTWRLKQAYELFREQPSFTTYHLVKKRLPGSTGTLADSYAQLAEQEQWQGLQTQRTIRLVGEMVEGAISIPMVGASGAVFGILLAFGMLFPRTTVLVFFILPMPAIVVVLLFGLIELLFGILNLPGDPIAHFAHLGGMLVGWVILRYWYRR